MTDKGDKPDLISRVRENAAYAIITALVSAAAGGFGGYQLKTDPAITETQVDNKILAAVNAVNDSRTASRKDYDDRFNGLSSRVTTLEATSAASRQKLDAVDAKIDRMSEQLTQLNINLAKLAAK